MSVVNESSLHDQMPGYHYARLMAIALKAEPGDSKAIQESARFLIGHAQPDASDVESLHRVCRDFAELLQSHPEMVHAHPGYAYWPFRTLADALLRVGIKVTFDVVEVQA